MGLGHFFQGFCISTHANVISLVAYKLCRSCPHPEKLHFYTLSYRWKILRSTNPGNPQPSNYFELPFFVLLKLWYLYSLLIRTIHSWIVHVWKILYQIIYFKAIHSHVICFQIIHSHIIYFALSLGFRLVWDQNLVSVLV